MSASDGLFWIGPGLNGLDASGPDFQNLDIDAATGVTGNRLGLTQPPLLYEARRNLTNLAGSLEPEVPLFAL